VSAGIKDPRFHPVTEDELPWLAYSVDVLGEAQAITSMEELDVITTDIIKYLKNEGGNELLEPHFNEREILHMDDVQKLFDLERMIKYITIILKI